MLQATVEIEYPPALSRMWLNCLDFGKIISSYIELI
jgi:hypothetical protein